MLHFGDLSYETRRAIAKLYAAKDWEDLAEGDKTWLELESGALMFFRLRLCQDDPLIFPKGKWATIQVLEQLMNDAVKEEVNA